MKLIGGSVCLDFVNTVGARVSVERAHCLRDYADCVLRDKLKDYRDLLEWSQMAGIASASEARRLSRLAARDPQSAKRALARATRLREALYRIFKSLVEGWRPIARDVDLLRKALSIAKAQQALLHSGAGFVWAFRDEDSLDAPLWRVSESASDLLTSTDVSQLRQCSGDECGWMFLDTSRNRSRHWCDMKDCGNRAKVRRFRQRQQREGALRK